MRRKLLAAGAAVLLALSLSACGSREPQRCVDRNGTEYVCDDDDDFDGGWFPVFIPWSQPHQPSYPKPYKPSYKAPGMPAPKPPAYKAPAPAPRAPSMPRSK